MTLDEWLQSPELQKAWRSTWNEDHMKIGMQVLRNAMPDVTVHLNGAADAITAAGMRDCAREGAKVMVRTIDLMKEGEQPPAAQPPMSLALIPEDGEPLPGATTPAPKPATRTTPK